MIQCVVDIYGICVFNNILSIMPLSYPVCSPRARCQGRQGWLELLWHAFPLPVARLLEKETAKLFKDFLIYTIRLTTIVTVLQSFVEQVVCSIQKSKQKHIAKLSHHYKLYCLINVLYPKNLKDLLLFCLLTLV